MKNLKAYHHTEKDVAMLSFLQKLHVCSISRPTIILLAIISEKYESIFNLNKS